MMSVLLLALFASPAHAGTTIEVDVPEPSGIDHDRVGERIFVADDGGELWVFDTDFNELDVFDLGGDLEGVDCVPATDQLLVAVEGDEQILVVDPDSGSIEAELDIPRTWNGQTIMAAGGNGIETLTVVGRRIFVANQSFDEDDETDGSVLVELAITPNGKLRIVDAHRLPVIDIAGSLYEPRSKSLYLLSDANNRIYRLPIRGLDTLDTGESIPAALLRTFRISGENQEGMCILNGDLVIAQDSGDLHNAGNFRWVLSLQGQMNLMMED